MKNQVHCETINNEAKEQEAGFLGMLLGTLAVSVLGNMLASKHKIRGRGVIGTGSGTIREGEGTTRSGQDF